MFTSLRLERFKNFKDAELKLGPFNVLIGANAAGKSNLRDAFRFLHGIARGYSLADIIGEKYGEGGERVWSGIRGGTREIAFSGEQSFALTSQSIFPHGIRRFGNEYGGESLRYRIAIEIKYKKLIPQNLSELLEVINHCHLFSSEIRNRLTQNIMLYDENDRFGGIGPYISPRTVPFLGYMARENWLGGSQYWPASDSAISHQLSEDDLHDHLLEFFQEYHEAFLVYRSSRFFDWSLDALRQPSLPGQDVLGDNGRNLSSVLHAICQDKQGKQNLLSWVRELTPMDAVDLEFPADPAGRVLATLIERNKQKITLASTSDGTLRFLAFLAAFLGPHTTSFYFFEELENGIHPTRLNLLLDLIENQVKTKDIQVVATTHSPQLLGRLSKESLEHASLVYRVPEEPDARIIRVLDMPDAKRLIRKYKAPDLFAEGWFEDTAHYMQPDPDEDKLSKPPMPPSKSRARA
jgi:predicted ATPase